MTNHLRDQLSLSVMGTEHLQIKTIGAGNVQNTSSDVVELDINTREGETLKVVIPFICNPFTSQPINYSNNYLIGLELAVSADFSDVLEIDMLIGSVILELGDRTIYQGGQWTNRHPHGFIRSC